MMRMDEAGELATARAALALAGSSLRAWVTSSSQQEAPKHLLLTAHSPLQYRRHAIHTIPRRQHAAPAGLEPHGAQPRGQHLPYAAEETTEPPGQQAYAYACAGMDPSANMILVRRLM